MVDPLQLKLDDLALPLIIQQMLDQLNASAAAATTAPRPSAVVGRQLKTALSPDLVSAGDHCLQWHDHFAVELQGLRPKVQVARYLSHLAAMGDLVYLVPGWNAVVAPVFGVSREAIRQAKNTWLADHPASDATQEVAE